MPAATRRSKSEAYEQGIREGMAMSRRARVMKPSEEEEMEMDMGMDPNHSRKRSAKGAKRTKPATDGMGKKKPMDGGMYGKKPMDGGMGMNKEMDGGMKKSMDMCGGMKKSMDGGMYGKKPMDGECDCRGKKGCKCDGNCGSMRKRSDSLTPQEYLAACDLGIQDRSTAYIRARLDTAEARNDLKCGNGAISEGENCTKGTAQKVQPKQYKGGNVAPNKKASGRLRTAANVTRAVGAVAPLVGLASKGPTGLVAGFGVTRTALSTAGALSSYAKAQESGSAVGRARLQREAKGAALSAAGTAVSSLAGTLAMRELTRKQSNRQSLENAFRKPSAKRPPGLDSMFADGFAPGNFDI